MHANMRPLNPSNLRIAFDPSLEDSSLDLKILLWNLDMHIREGQEEDTDNIHNRDE